MSGDWSGDSSGDWSDPKSWDEGPDQTFPAAIPPLACRIMLNRALWRGFAGDRRLAGPASIVGVWTVVAIAAAVQAVALVRLDGRADLVGAVVSRVSIIPLWALATPLILRSARWYPVVDAERRVSLPFVALHLVAASAFVVLTNALIRVPAALAPVAEGGGVVTLVRSTMQGVAEYFPPAVVVYGVIVAIGHALFRPSGGASSAPPVVPALPSAPASLASPEATAESAADVQPDEHALGGSNGDRQTPVADEAAETGDAKAEPSAPVAVAALDGHITVRQWNRVHLVRVEDIDFVEAEDNYVVVHAASRTYKGRDRISDVESQLDARRFVRIHRSTIVHLAKIREVQPLTHGDHAVILRDGRVLRVARSRRQALGDALGVQL